MACITIKELSWRCWSSWMEGSRSWHQSLRGYSRRPHGHLRRIWLDFCKICKPLYVNWGVHALGNIKTEMCATHLWEAEIGFSPWQSYVAFFTNIRQIIYFVDGNAAPVRVVWKINKSAELFLQKLENCQKVIIFPGKSLKIWKYLFKRNHERLEEQRHCRS